MIVPVNKIPLKIRLQLWVNMSVRHKQIHPSIVVVVEKLRSPTNIRQTYGGDFRRVRNVSEGVIAIVMIESVVIVIEVSLENVESPVVIVITTVTPMLPCSLPFSLTAVPELNPISLKVPSPSLWYRKLGVESFAT